MAFNKNLYKDRSLFPLTEPNQAGQQTKLGIEPNDYNGNVDGLKFHYSFGKGEGLYYVAPPGMIQDIIDTFGDVLKKREKHCIPIENSRSKVKGEMFISVGRDETLRPYIQLSGNVGQNGQLQRKSKKFFFYMPKGFRLLKDGQPMSDLEVEERRMRSFANGPLKWFLEDLLESYNPQEFNKQGGGSYGKGSYNNQNQQRGNGNGGGQYSQPSAPQTNTEYNPDMFE